MNETLDRGTASGIAVRSGILIGAGVIALAFPDEGLRAAAVLIAALLVVDGVSVTAAAARNEGSLRWLLALQGIAGVVLGILSITLSGDATDVALVFAAWSLVSGVIDVLAALRLGGTSQAAGLIGTGGVLSLMAGALLLAAPDGNLGLALQLFGAYQLGRGLVALSLSGRVGAE